VILFIGISTCLVSVICQDVPNLPQLKRIHSNLEHGPTYSTQVLALIAATSKAAQGLFVPCQHLRVCTENSNSQIPCWRQPGSRSAIHAGHHLSVKEFRYLRTVIVAAAVCLSLWAGVRLCTGCALAESCVFGKQSLPAFCCYRSRPCC
jgi:hypothetical protein